MMCYPRAMLRYLFPLVMIGCAAPPPPAPKPPRFTELTWKRVERPPPEEPPPPPIQHDPSGSAECLAKKAEIDAMTEELAALIARDKEYEATKCRMHATQTFRLYPGGTEQYLGPDRYYWVCEGRGVFNPRPDEKTPELRRMRHLKEHLYDKECAPPKPYVDRGPGMDLR